MSYFISDIKKLYKNRLVQFAMIVLLFLAVLEPLHIYVQTQTHSDYYQELGKHPFQFWLLMFSGLGSQIYFTFLYIFPVLSTGLVFFYESSSSMYNFLIIRKSRKNYFLSKIISLFLVTLVNFFTVFLINILITFIVFSSDPSNIGTQFQHITPNVNSFAYAFFQISPLTMAVWFAFLNAFAIAILSIFVLGIQMIGQFRQVHFAFLIPLVLLYSINYIFTFFLYPKYSLKRILQARLSSFKVVSTGKEVLILFSGILLISLISILLGWKRNKDSL